MKLIKKPASKSVKKYNSMEDRSSCLKTVVSAEHKRGLTENVVVFLNSF